VRKLARSLRACARVITRRRRATFVLAAALAVVSVQAGIVWAGDAATTTDGARAAAASRNGTSGPALPKQVGRHVFVGHSYKNDISRSLRAVPALPYKRSRQRVIPAFKIRHSHSRASVPDAARQTKASAPKMPSPILNFDGIPYPGVNCGCAPPDTNGEVGLTQYVQIVNQGFEVYNKTTGASVFGPVDIATVWSGFGGVCEDDAWGDPVVLYDQLANRWVISQFAGFDTNGAMTDECVAVSTTSDATGSWNRYAFHLGTDFFDYPKLGVWPDAYYMSMNVFDADTENFIGPQPFALDRDAMLAGDPASFVTFRDPSTFFKPSSDAFMPADLDGLTPPPGGAPNPFMSTGTNATWPLYRFHVDFATPANSTFAPGGTLTPAAFSPICGGGACVPQLGGELLDTLGDRGMFRSAYRKFADHEALVGNMTIASGGVAGVRWFEVRNATSGTPTFFQQGTQAPPDGVWRWMGSAAMDNAGNLAVGYSASSASLHPQIRYAGRFSGDPLGQLAQGEAHLFDGAGSQTTNTLHRWGDYSDMTVDPVNDCTFWYTQEYYSTNSSFNWRTRIGNFTFAPTNCTSPNVAHVTVAKAADEPSVFQGDQIGFTVELANDGDATATALTFIDNLPGGTGLDWSIDASDPGWSISGTAPNQTLVYTPTTLAGGTPTQAHVVSDTTSDSCGTYTNTASFTSTNGGSGTASDSTIVSCLTITKTAEAPSVSAGNQIGFTVTLNNVSTTVTAAGVTVTDPLPAGTGVDWSIATADSGWSLSGAPPNETLTFSGNLAPGTSQVHVISGTGSQSCGDYVNTASFTSTDQGSGEASDVVSVSGCPFLEIFKVADANNVPIGAPIGFYVELDNFGDAAATGLTISDPLPSGPGVSWVVDAANSTAGWSISGSPPSQSLVYSPTSLDGGDFVYVHIVSLTSGTSCATLNNTAQFGSANAGTGSSSDSVSLVGCPPPALFHTLTVNKGGSGAGTVTSSPAGINCGPSCSLQFNNGAAVTLTAAASSGSRFTGWSGDCSGTGACALTMSVDHNVTATFSRILKCRVPKVVGKKLAAAKSRIRAAHCRVGKITKKKSSRKKKGRVLAQKPKPGKTLPAGSKVKLTVGKGPK
jgi:uncharacterized repeat protein (TIGR01451 family)